MAELISSAANPLVKRVRLLADGRHRRRESAFVVHGIQPVWQAVEAAADIEALIVAPDLLRGPAAAMVTEQEQRGIRVARLSADLFGRISDRDGPTGLAAIVRYRAASLAGLEVRPDSVFVALHENGNPGNLGSIIRTASASGASGVILIGATTDPHDPAAVRASMGAIFSVPVAHAAAAPEFGGWCRQHGITVAAMSGHASPTLWGQLQARPLVILLGAEGTGLPEELLRGGDLNLRIPMTGTADSLNLAVAAGICLYEARREQPGWAPAAGAGLAPAAGRGAGLAPAADGGGRAGDGHSGQPAEGGGR
jgi:TrmH family RNA methyltransferase